MGTQLPLSQRCTAPKFSAHICCGQMAGWIKMPHGTEIGLSPSDIVLDGDPAPLPKKGSSPQFSAHVWCDQMARWIKMALGTEIGLGSVQRRCVRWRPSSLKGGRPPVFGPCLLWPNGWMDENATWYGRRSQPRPHYVRWGPSSPLRKGHSSPPLFRPMSIVASVDHLSYC